MRVVIVASAITLFALIGDEILLASVSNDTHRTDQQMPGRGGETDVAQLGYWPSTPTVPTVPAR